jgi:hypothetical protein
MDLELPPKLTPGSAAILSAFLLCNQSFSEVSLTFMELSRGEDDFSLAKVVRKAQTSSIQDIFLFT